MQCLDTLPRPAATVDLPNLTCGGIQRRKPTAAPAVGVDANEMSQIKSSYRQLMRKYHPDMHAGNPGKQKAANELSMRVTTAYNGLQAHLGAGK